MLALWSIIDYNLSINKGETISSLFINNSMYYYTSLVKTIDKLNAEGKLVKLTKLPSVVNIKRKPIKF